ILYLPIAALGCQQKMADQPSYRPLEASRFFADGRSARPLEPGTVSQDVADFGSVLMTGRMELNQPSAGSTIASVSPASQSLGGSRLDNYSPEFPFPITLKELQRGQDRYTIYCAVCHGPVGNGHGVVVEGGFTKPPSYLSDNSRGLAHRGIRMPLTDVPVG